MGVDHARQDSHQFGVDDGISTLIFGGRITRANRPDVVVFDEDVAGTVDLVPVVDGDNVSILDKDGWHFGLTI
jgi:hypothetical protein